jgi:hypothetical protein
MAGNKDTALSSLHSAIGRNRRTQTPKKPKTRRATARRRSRRSDDDDRVTTFPEVKGKVVRQVRFTHDDPNKILAIAFKDRTVLYFQIDPEPLVLPLDIRAHYVGERRSADKSWEELGKGRT